MKKNVLENSMSTNELCKEYSWYKDTFSPVIQDASDKFFDDNFRLEFIGLSKNINCMINEESCFVTKVKIDDEYDIFFRLTDQAIEIILEKILGKSKNKFNINKITEIESKIMTAFNCYMYNALRLTVDPPAIKELKRTNFDMINMTFLILDADEEIKKSGKVVVTVPMALLKPVQVESEGEKFSVSDFLTSKIPVSVIVGSTRFPLYEIKNLDVGDVVVFENSKLEAFKMMLYERELTININPNMGILMPQQEDTGGDSMAGADKNLWDTIEVDLIAEFDAVKISLGDLKKIEEGMVMDMASLYNNKIALKVEGTTVAKGSLVIVNDRYGVKISEIMTKAQENAAEVVQRSQNNNEEYSEEETNEENTSENNSETNENEEKYENTEEGNEEDFDYSDFELEDEDNI